MSIIELNELEEGNYNKLIRAEIGKIIDLSKMLSGTGTRDKNVYKERDALRNAANIHSWTRSTVSAIARSAIGGGFSVVKHPIFGKGLPSDITEDEAYVKLEFIYNFLFGTKEECEYIQDIDTFSQKMYYTIASFVLYGQAAWHLRRNENGELYDFDVLSGITFPNVNENGKFLKPAYTFRPWDSQSTYDFNNPNDILYLHWPGVDNSIYGNSEYIAVAENAIPSDMYAARAYKSHFENMNAPYNGVWNVDANTSDEDFYNFLKLLASRYTGVDNWGRNPLVIKGQAEFKETRSRSNDDAPYLQGRQYNQEEISAVTGVSGVKLGLSGQATKANYREQRREFHETTLRPIFEIIEQAIYKQIFVRGFGQKEWMLVFNKPDFTNALEDASIYARYITNGVMNPNEARAKLGLPNREDGYGEVFYQPNSAVIAGTEADGPEDEGGADQVDQTEGGSERQHDPEDIPSKDKPQVDKSFDLSEMQKELRQWKRFAMRIADGTRKARKFHTKAIPEEVAQRIENLVNSSESKQEVSQIFDVALDSVEGD